MEPNEQIGRTCLILVIDTVVVRIDIKMKPEDPSRFASIPNRWLIPTLRKPAAISIQTSQDGKIKDENKQDNPADHHFLHSTPLTKSKKGLLKLSSSL